MIDLAPAMTLEALHDFDEIREEGQRQLAEAKEWFRVYAIRTGLADPHTRLATKRRRYEQIAGAVEGFNDVRHRGITTGGGLE